MVTASRTESVATTSGSPSQIENDEKILKVQLVVSKAGQDIRIQYPILKHQNAIGSTILILSVAGMLACAYGYYIGVLPAWLCIPTSAIFASFTHEIEHDLIHFMYFRKKMWAHHLMLALAWLARPNTIGPWARRRMHLHHHKVSGTEFDLEERAISNGMPWGIRRLLVISDQFMSVYLRPIQMIEMLRLFAVKFPQQEKRAAVLSQVFGFFPLSFVHYGLWYMFVIFHTVNYVVGLVQSNDELLWMLFGSQTSNNSSLSIGSSKVGLRLSADNDAEAINDIASSLWPAVIVSAMPLVNFLAVVWTMPNVLRSFCLQFISSNMHYYGDIDPRDVIKQTQVLDPWWLIPMQIFCCNFGSTHAIHHFFMKEPFYIRQLTSSEAHTVMREVGVRFNDFGTFKRVNRWNKD